MKIRIASLHKGPNRWREFIASADIDIDPVVYPNGVTVDLTADRQVSRVSITVLTHAVGQFICDRCGDPFQGDIGGDCAVEFVRRESPLPDEMPGDDLRSFTLEQDELDITAEVRDALLLAVPMKLLCRDDCRGLCPGCGANLNHETCRCSRTQDQ